MRILGIETSCDDTSIAIVSIDNNQSEVLSFVVSSQTQTHTKYGGIVPYLAAREHANNLDTVLKLVLRKADIPNIKDLDAIAVTIGPGLAPSLLTGLSFAKALAWKYNKPLIGVNHMKGHVYSNWLLPEKENGRFPVTGSRSMFPSLVLIVSGGHTELVIMNDYEKFERIGATLDDAAGEAFDKIARLIGLEFPGGPILAKRAEKVKERKTTIELPRPMIKSGNYNFSFSGLKTAVLYLVKKLEKDQDGKLSETLIDEISSEAQQAIVDVLVAKTIDAAEEFNVSSIMLAGGVSANKLLRQTLGFKSKEIGIPYFQPLPEYTTDNGAMIAMAGYFKKTFSMDNESYHWQTADIEPNLDII